MKGHTVITLGSLGEYLGDLHGKGAESKEEPMEKLLNFLTFKTINFALYRKIVILIRI